MSFRQDPRFPNIRSMDLPTGGGVGFDSTSREVLIYGVEQVIDLDTAQAVHTALGKVLRLAKRTPPPPEKDPYYVAGIEHVDLPSAAFSRYTARRYHSMRMTHIREFNGQVHELDGVFNEKTVRVWTGPGQHALVPYHRIESMGTRDEGEVA